MRELIALFLVVGAVSVVLSVTPLPGVAAPATSPTASIDSRVVEMSPAVRLTPPTTTTAPAQIAVPTPPRYHHPSAAVDRHYAAVIAAGWPKWEWPRVACIIHRESRGKPSAYVLDGDDDSYGLVQINLKAHRGWVGPLVDWDFTRLFDPYTNLSIARELYHRADRFWGTPWRPWNSSGGSCR